MTIGYVIDDTLDNADGVQAAVVDIAEHMRARGHDVHYIVPTTNDRDLQNIHSVGKLVKLKFNGNSIGTPLPASKKKIKRLLEDVKFDVLHVQMPYSPLLAAKVIKLSDPDTTIVGTFHILPYNWLAKYGTKLLGWWLHGNKKRINKAYGNSKPSMEFMRDYFGLAGDILPNPVDYELFHSKAKKQNNTKVKISCVARFEERKGVKQLVKAYELLPDNVREFVELRMYGKGPLSDELSKYSQDRGLGIEMPGFISFEDKVKFLAESDIAIFPSTGGESFGIVLTEAMSAGAGVTIGGNNPGYASVLQTWPECLFDARTPESIATKLEDVINNLEKYKKIGNLQHQAVKQYDIKLICDRLEKEAYVLS